MSQEVLQVNALVSQGAWSVTGANAVSAVNQQDDDDATFVSATTNGSIQYAVSPTAVVQSGDTINFVRIVGRFAGDFGQVRGVFSFDPSGGSQAGGVHIQPVATYTDFSDDFTTWDGVNPWTKAKVDALNIICQRVGIGTNQMRLTSFYVIVDYTHVNVQIPDAPPERMMTVLAESRIMVVDFESRVMVVPSESRILIVPAESRTMVVPFDDRTMEVT
jgi:hypothetical protein